MTHISSVIRVTFDSLNDRTSSIASGKFAGKTCHAMFISSVCASGDLLRVRSFKRAPADLRFHGLTFDNQGDYGFRIRT